jgi:hypothetical protein
MGKEQAKKMIGALIEQGRSFTWEAIPKSQGSSSGGVYGGDPSPEFSTWVNRIDKAISELCREDSAPYRLGKKGINAVSVIRGNGQDVFTRVMGDLTKSLELVSAGLEEDFFGELVEPQAVEVPAMKVTREGVFFAGQYFDALQKVAEIISQAKKCLTIIDGYVDERVLNILTSKSDAVRVDILTKNATPALKTASITFNLQYGKLSIRTSPTFHDRFVIVDDKEFYHFGASIKDLGNRGFMFSLIEEPDVMNALRKKFAQDWASATVVV